MQPPANGTDERLDALINEVKALRALLDQQVPPPPAGQIALREPASPSGSPQRDLRPQKRGR